MVRKRLVDVPGTLESVNNLAVLFTKKGDYAGAEPLFRRAARGWVEISRSIGTDPPNLSACLGNYAGCLEKPGRSQEQSAAALRELGVGLERAE